MKQEKLEQEHNMCETRIQQDFIIRKKWKHNKTMIKKIPKIGVENAKGNGESYPIYTHCTLNSRKFFKKLLIYMWPMFTHVHPCVNYEWIKT